MTLATPATLPAAAQAHVATKSCLYTTCQGRPVQRMYYHMQSMVVCMYMQAFVHSCVGSCLYQG